MMRADPLENPVPLIRRVYAYAAYRLGDGPDAEDATSDTFERALRYRKSYDKRKGEPAAWLLGIARRCVDDIFAARPPTTDTEYDQQAPGELDSDAVRRLSVQSAVLQLDDRARELIALRYGADLTAKQIARLFGERTNTIEVALHRALAKLRSTLDDDTALPTASRSSMEPPTVSTTLGRDA
jgi:RNA polymerase sigma-70 factor (ECF subfamily)